jgi:hypothetical protein
MVDPIEEPIMKTATFRRAVRLFTITAALSAAACGEVAPVPDDLLADDQPFIAVPRASSADVAEMRSALTTGPGGAGAMGVQPGENNFYLAIRKDVLDQPWFLSAFLKQFQDRSPSISVPFFSLGTRVVSFERQNDKLFLFDVSGQHTASAVIDPPNVLEAYPLVDLPEFNRLRGADRYVLIDPSAGLNRFGITGDLFEDWPFSAYPEGDLRLRVGIAFMQNFRQLADGVSFDEIFTGEIAGVEPAPYTAWGTLGLTIRRYGVGDGFEPTPESLDPLYFTTGYRLIPDSGGAADRSVLKWNLRPGLAAVKIHVGDGAARAQADYPGVDVMGAFWRGVEGWNDVFGFRVFEAVFVGDDAVRDDDKSFMLVDYPGAGLPFAFADFRANPINGEIRGGSVYFSGAFFDSFAYIEDDPPAGAVPTAPAAAPPAPASSARLRLMSWAGLAARPLCAYSARATAPHAARTSAAGVATALTADQKRALYIQHVVAHEFGHVLGLRHNFAGSLEPPSSSVMDYIDTDLAVQAADPRPHDRESLQYLYGLSSAPPAHPFCTDEQLAASPLCQLFDRGADPLRDDDAPTYGFLLGLFLDGLLPPSPSLDYWLDTYLNATLGFARDTGTVDPADRTLAIAIALDRTAVPMSAADRASPGVVARANAWGEHVLRRIVLDDPSLRGNMTGDVSDPAVIALVAAQAGRMLRDEDGVRAPSLRRAAVDVLERLQDDVGLLELAASRDAIQAALSGGQIPAQDTPFVEDILARIQRALAPYFD